MASSQKDENRIGLYAAVVLNAVVLYSLVTTDRLELNEWVRALTDWHLAIPAVIGLAFITIVNSQISTANKERIVFWKRENPLPGSRAFTEFLVQDPRIDAAALLKRFGPFPTDPFFQNKLWYHIYSTVRDEPSISTQRRTYLFCRDYAVLAVLMMVVFGGIALTQIKSASLIAIYFGLLVLQYGLNVNAARVTAERWVTTAMAIASTKEGR